MKTREDYILPDGQLGCENSPLKEGDLLTITLNGIEYEAIVTYDPPVSLRLREIIPNGNAFLVMPQPPEQLAYMQARRV